MTWNCDWGFWKLVTKRFNLTKWQGKKFSLRKYSHWVEDAHECPVYLCQSTQFLIYEIMLNTLEFELNLEASKTKQESKQVKLLSSENTAWILALVLTRFNFERAFLENLRYFLYSLLFLKTAVLRNYRCQKYFKKSDLKKSFLQIPWGLEKRPLFRF